MGDDDVKRGGWHWDDVAGRNMPDGAEVDSMLCAIADLRARLAAAERERDEARALVRSWRDAVCGAPMTATIAYALIRTDAAVARWDDGGSGDG